LEVVGGNTAALAVGVAMPVAVVDSRVPLF
jgi:hypothetical protein